ncbi:hypothetical protein PaG_04194 [Moesziomyces aphidis]|uniref:Uncharacterized protein n=1 Tax=Moesziomyces aphidis TaxID=84754 RepID=W3VJJ8_MOEAP|nr:hypothetical protein PaG_04194 [Moesziomyces aphidis]
MASLHNARFLVSISLRPNAYRLLICPSLPPSSKSALHLQVFDFLGIILGRLFEPSQNVALLPTQEVCNASIGLKSAPWDQVGASQRTSTAPHGPQPSFGHGGPIDGRSIAIATAAGFPDPFPVASPSRQRCTCLVFDQARDTVVHTGTSHFRSHWDAYSFRAKCSSVATRLTSVLSVSLARGPGFLSSSSHSPYSTLASSPPHHRCYTLASLVVKPSLNRFKVNSVETNLNLVGGPSTTPLVDMVSGSRDSVHNGANGSSSSVIDIRGNRRNQTTDLHTGGHKKIINVHGESRSSILNFHGGVFEKTINFFGDSRKSAVNVHGGSCNSIVNIYGDSRNSVISIFGDSVNTIINVYGDSHKSTIILHGNFNSAINMNGGSHRATFIVHGSFNTTINIHGDSCSSVINILGGNVDSSINFRSGSQNGSVNGVRGGHRIRDSA